MHVLIADAILRNVVSEERLRDWLRASPEHLDERTTSMLQLDQAIRAWSFTSYGRVT